MVCLYILLIGGDWVAKVFKGFRFDPELYVSFKKAGFCERLYGNGGV